MKKLAVLLLSLPVAAFAAEPAPPSSPPPAAHSAQSVSNEDQYLVQILQASAEKDMKIMRLMHMIDELTKERDALKAAQNNSKPAIH